MKRIMKLTGYLLMILLLTMNPLMVFAQETYGYVVDKSPSPVAIGSEVTLTFRLTDYTEKKSGIRGFQIDLTDVDDVLHEAKCTSLVKDKENVLTDTVKYQPSRDIVRHAYVKMSGTMSYADSNLSEVKFTIPKTYTKAGTLTLPLKILIQNAAGDKLTYTDKIEINYAPEGELPPEPYVTNVEVSWGEMEFEYTDGIWNARTYTYEGAGWTDNGTGYVTVKNTGAKMTTATFTYTSERTDIIGSFDVVGTAELTVGNELTARLSLSGKPERNLEENTVIGRATVTIGGTKSE